MQHNMDSSSKIKISRFIFPISIHWARHYEASYELLRSDKKKPNTRRRVVMQNVRLGHRRTRLFIVGICRRICVRIQRVYSYNWGLLLKRLEPFYLRFFLNWGRQVPERNWWLIQAFSSIPTSLFLCFLHLLYVLWLSKHPYLGKSVVQYIIIHAHSKDLCSP